MSIQAECREAMNRLAARGVTFTERDVTDSASMPNWTRKQYAKAARAAYAVLQGDYRMGRLCRFGPVDVNGQPDYVRNNAKIVYASAERGPQYVETPNGNFARMMAAADQISSVGRRSGIDRDDFALWHQDDDLPRESEDRESVAASSDGASDGWTADQLERLADALAPKVAEKIAALTQVS